MDPSFEKLPQPEPALEPQSEMPADKSDHEEAEHSIASKIDMEAILEKVPPIEGVFSPEEEVAKLWEVPKSERREAVEEFKSKLARQRDAWALCQASIKQLVNREPDASREDMVGVVEEFSPHYGFTEKQVDLAKQLIGDYMIMHNEVRRVRDEFPDNLELVRHLTMMKLGEDYRNAFRVAVGPASIDIFTGELTAKKLFEKTDTPTSSFLLGGFASESQDAYPIFFTVINTGCGGEAAVVSLLSHEHGHAERWLYDARLHTKREVRPDVREALNSGIAGFLRARVLEEVFGFKRNFGKEVFGAYKTEEDLGKKAFLLEEYFKLQRAGALDRAKGEMSAMIEEAAPHGLLPHSCDRFFVQDGGPYDYLLKTREYWDKEKDPQWEEISQRVLVDEYRNIVEKGVNAFDILVQNGYSTDTAIALLAGEPLEQWPKTVREQFKARGIKIPWDSFEKRKVRV